MKAREELNSSKWFRIGMRALRALVYGGVITAAIVCLSGLALPPAQAAFIPVLTAILMAVDKAVREQKEEQK